MSISSCNLDCRLLKSESSFVVPQLHHNLTRNLGTIDDHERGDAGYALRVTKIVYIDGFTNTTYISTELIFLIPSFHFRYSQARVLLYCTNALVCQADKQNE